METQLVVTWQMQYVWISFIEIFYYGHKASFKSNVVPTIQYAICTQW